ncbi:hypothetical protein [Vibrio alginolyticus]|uniref:hypothetical protein n=1 Tax=Vibrio alginolyticus TaxID=663 RepID=UPI0006CA879E|nr:hypothetical protein [Vibrio alginolyticus]KPM98433.1 hypothetical protein AOG25_08285 [Vibrio alginolyticus]CAH7137297.1 conserved hypothetical protein [Vibrio chagasii]CAH7228540.1 conserved hypothetical protein [Vibrio chagasii]
MKSTVWSAQFETKYVTHEDSKAIDVEHPLLEKAQWDEFQDTGFSFEGSVTVRLAFNDEVTEDEIKDELTADINGDKVTLSELRAW